MILRGQKAEPAGQSSFRRGTDPGQRREIGELVVARAIVPEQTGTLAPDPVDRICLGWMTKTQPRRCAHLERSHALPEGAPPDGGGDARLADRKDHVAREILRSIDLSGIGDRTTEAGYLPVLGLAKEMPGAWQ